MDRLHRVAIESTTHPLFAPAWELYQSAFPEEERRSLAYHRDTLRLPEFHFEAILAGSAFVGFIGWWNFPTCRYIEHLATDPSLRGKGYGKEVLEIFQAESMLPIFLEVEHPEDAITERRIGFYQRLGFQLNDHIYAHPPYHKKEGKYLSLLVMTSPSRITEEELSHFKTNCFPRIHWQWYVD